MIRSDDIGLLVQSGETQTLEFKSSFDRDVIETLVAFANIHVISLAFSTDVV